MDWCRILCSARGFRRSRADRRERGIEFGTSPFPLGLAQAQELRTLFDAPVLATIGAEQSLTTRYTMFLTPAPPEWTAISDVTREGEHLILQTDNAEQLRL